MNARRKALLERARKLYSSDDVDAHARLRVDVLAAALTPRQTKREAERVAAAFQRAKTETSIVKARADRLDFREWMRIQVYAEQGAMFRGTASPNWRIERE